MTLAQLEALEERRAIAIRHARFNAALTASVLINVHRGEDQEAVSPFDFIAGFETSPEEIEKRNLRKSVRRSIAGTFARIADRDMEFIQAEKRRMIERLTEKGIEDPEGLIREVYPEL